MNNQFDPRGKNIQLLLQGMSLEEQGKLEEAHARFTEAWMGAEDDFERFLTSFFAAKHQPTVKERLTWLETSLAYARKVKDEAVKSALPALYGQIAQCQKTLGEDEEARKNLELAQALKGEPTDPGPFYHGTRADLQVGDLLTARRDSNYQADLQMNHIYFTALLQGAGLAAALAKGEGRERIYVVEPTGAFEHDPNVTDKKFPGNLTRSYRSTEPLRIIGEATQWLRLTTEEFQEWQQKLAKNKGEIIN